MKKRLLSALLCLCMVLILLPAGAWAADGTTISVDGTNKTLAAAISEANSGDTLQLTANITLSSSGVTISKDITLDLNGHAITSTGSFTLFSVGASGSSGTTKGQLTVTDSSTGGSITGESKLFHVADGSELSLGGGIVLSTDNYQNPTAPALQNEGGTVNVLAGGFSIHSEANNAIYNHGGTFSGDNISFSASTGNKLSGATLKLEGGTVTELNAQVASGRTDPAIQVEYGTVEITGGSYTATGSINGALLVSGGTVTLKGGTFSNTSYSSDAISVVSGTYASLLGAGFGYTTDNGATFLTDETDLKAATSLTVMAQSAQSGHTHAVSVGCETGSGTQVAFQALSDMSAPNLSGYTLNGGSYYLTDNADVGGSLTIRGDVTLCLNGHTLSLSVGKETEAKNIYAAISVPQGSSLTVCDCGQSKGKIAFQTGGMKARTAIGGAGNVTLYGCAVKTSKTSANAAYGLCNTGGAFTLYDSHISAIHTTSGSGQTPFADAIEGMGGTTVIHGGSLSATVTNGTTYTDGNSGARGLYVSPDSTAYLLGNPTITTSNSTNADNQADVYVPSPSAQFWLSQDGESYGGSALTVWVSSYGYSDGGTVIRGVGENGAGHTIKNAPNGFVGTVIETGGRKDLVLTGPYKVTFNANGGSGTTAGLAFTGWTDSKALTANGFTGANGAPFQGWNTKADGSGTGYADGATVSGLAYSGTVTLYAQWGAAQGHTHAWPADWSSNSTHHWHQCTAAGCTITDYSTCGEAGAAYGAHTTQYTHNQWTHWQVCAVCGDFDQDRATEGEHVYDDDQDTTCNTCGYTRTITPPDSGSTQGKVEVVGDAPRTSVDEESLEGLITETPQAGETITVKLTVEKKDEATAPGAADIKGVAAGKTVEFLDLSLVKTVTGGTNPRNEPIDNAANVLEIAMDYDLSGKKDVTVYRYHNGTAEALTKNDTKADGTFQLGTNSITIYTTKFSTYAIGYAPDGGGNQPQPPSGGGNGGGGYVPPTYAVDLPASTPGGKLSASHKSASSGATVTLTLTPEKGYEIGGVTVTDQNGKTVAVTDKGNGRYTFPMPSGKVTVKAEFTKSKGGYADCPKDDSCPIRRFIDADPAAWYHDGVHYCVENGLMSGYGGLFRPDDSLSRAEFVQVLHNLEGKPVVNYLMGFEDVPGGAWYAEAVRWAASRQIAGGYGNGRFGPNHSISREELAVMLWRYAGRPAATDKELNFADAEKASGWATGALCWAVDQGILRGKDGGILDPKGMTTRAEAAAVLQRVFRHGSPAKWR